MSVIPATVASRGGVKDERPPLRDLLLERARSGSRRGRRTDPFRIAMVIECGGMRGVAAAGALQAIADADCLEAFDSVHGSSAGACAAAYFLTGQAADGRKIYFEDICNRRVVNPYRIFSRPCMVDTDYIANVVMGELRAINAQKIIAEPDVLNVITASVRSGLPVTHSAFKSRDEILAAMKATLRVPGFREPGVLINGELHLDGGIVAPIPVFSAIGAGATHVLVIGTQRENDYNVKYAYTAFEAALLRSLYGLPLARAYLAAYAAPGAELKNEAFRSLDPIMIARAPASPFCAWHTIDTSILRAVEEDARSVARAFIEGSSQFKSVI